MISDPAPAERPLLLSMQEATRLLNLSRSTINRRIVQGDLKPRKIGRRTLFHRDELERFASGAQA